MSNGNNSNPSMLSSVALQPRLATPTQHRPPPPHQRSVSPGARIPSASTAAAMSRAERFEDEKRRIIESCFSKLDANGQLAESYITHIRIIEDAQHPSSPPPPESAENNKKPRLIIIAVRSTGRVRMHKARENNNGSFSIGKTWNLEELSAIETYGSANVPAQSEKEAQQKQWAGSVGFTVTITKPYYWQAGTSKEKDFFIASAVKIYRKYTKGLVPELKGLDEREKATMLGQPAPPQQQQQQQERSPAPQSQSGVSPGMRAESRAESRDMSPVAPPQPPFAQRPQSREESRYRGSPGPPASIHDARPGSAVPNRQQSESPAPPSLRPGHPQNQQQPIPMNVPRPFASQEHMRSQSRERSRQEYGGARPGTSPAPAYGRSPSSQQQGQPLPPPSIPSARSESPSASSLASSAGPGRPQVRNVSPGRQRQYQQPVNSVPEDRSMDSMPSQGYELEKAPAPPSHANGATAGAALLASTRQRWQAQNQNQRPLSPGPPQLPPIETSQAAALAAQQRSKGSGDAFNPLTAASEASSAGMVDLGDAAGIAALTSYWGPEPTPTSAPVVATPTIQAPPDSPLTPERSSRRPGMQERGISEASYDLRPPPLRSTGAAAGRAVSGDESGSRYATPQDRSAITSAAHTPMTEHPPPPEIRPLAVRDKRQSSEQHQQQQQRPLSSRRNDEPTKVAMPGAFTNTPVGPSPAGTPVETPREERGEEAVQPSAPTTTTTTATPNESPQEQQEGAGDAYRPGLGPMIKKNAIRDRFKKAATAASAFKPRPGGAAEKIMRAKAEREAGISPDAGDSEGVSGFVPRPVAAPVPKEVMDGKGMMDGNGEVHEAMPPKVEVDPATPITQPNGLGIVSAEMEKEKVKEKEERPRSVQLKDSPLPPTTDSQDLLQTPDQQVMRQKQEDLEAEEQAERDLFAQSEMRKPLVKVKRRSQTQQRNLAALGIDPTLLDGKALDFEAALEEFGWKDRSLDLKAMAALESDLKREQGRLEAGSWLALSDPNTPGGAADTPGLNESKVKAVESLLDKAIQECDDLEGLLMLYSVELGSLNEDVAFIEAQSQGLQVQSANQKGLVRELEGLVEVIGLDERVLEPLRYGGFGDPRGLEVVELAAGRLWGAMVVVDPGLRGAGGGRPKSRGLMVGGGDAGEALSGMLALREKRVVYEREAAGFVQRFLQHLDASFGQAMAEARRGVLRPASAGAGVGTKKLNNIALADAKMGLWVYGPLILFTKEVNRPAWTTALRLYHAKAQPVYAEAFVENISGWKRSARKPGAEEAELLFTATEREDPSGAGSGGGVPGIGAARKLTIKRSQTLAKTLRSAGSGSKHTLDLSASRSGQSSPAEVFAAGIDEMAPMISQEQNFISEFFWAKGGETRDFVEVVQALGPPEARAGGVDLVRPRGVEVEREMAGIVRGAMEAEFGFFAQEAQGLMEWCLAGDPIQGVGVMACLSRHSYWLSDTNQEFLLTLLEGLIARLQSLWTKFVDEQVRAIEDTKVKISKRKGVIGFMKIFPHFAAAVENCFAAVAGPDYESEKEVVGETRRWVDATYSRLNKAMFDSLKVIAKESPSAAPAASQHRGGTAAAAGGAAGGDDPEDKVVLNYHVLLIENMNHYVEEVDDGGREGVLAEWRGKALMERAEALEAYVQRVVKRPLGKLLDFLDSTDSLLSTHPNPSAIASRPSYSRKAARNTFSQYDAKEVRRGIDTLRKRIEKHFADGDEEAISRSLVGLVGKECERVYEKTFQRMEGLIGTVYPPTEGEKNVEVDFSREDVKAGFRR
ncbi:hypothetical protein LTS14_004972 [Recurvomyces mirabilis]|nr:hypothetical protein LTS14_004972 [Recurvomyces mirabilis]